MSTNMMVVTSLTKNISNRFLFIIFSILYQFLHIIYHDSRYSVIVFCVVRVIFSTVGC